MNVSNDQGSEQNPETITNYLARFERLQNYTIISN